MLGSRRLWAGPDPADVCTWKEYIWLAPVDKKPRLSVCSWVIIYSTFTCVSRARVARALYDAYDRLVLYRTDPVSAVVRNRNRPCESGVRAWSVWSGLRAARVRTQNRVGIAKVVRDGGRSVRARTQIYPNFKLSTPPLRRTEFASPYCRTAGPSPPPRDPPAALPRQT